MSKPVAALLSLALLFVSSETRAGWVQMGSDIDGESEGDESGYSVSLSSDGTTVAIGARGDDDNGQWSGHVRIYNTTLMAMALTC